MEKTVGYYFAAFGKVIVAVVVAVFLGLHTVNFFGYVFPADQQMYAWLGFGLTGGAMFVYLLIFKYAAQSNLVKAVAAVMLVVSVAGELAAAGFGMQVEAWQKSGYYMTEEDFLFMIRIVQLLGIFHAGALLLMAVGDEVFDMFSKKTVSSSSSVSAVSSNPLVIPRSPVPINRDDGNPTD